MVKKNIDIRDAFFEEIYKIISRDKNVIFLSDDMDALILRKIKRDFPKQYINAGVSEQSLMDVAAGLTSCGKKVFVYGIASYITMRCFEQIKFSIASMKLPVVIVGVGTGFSFSFDGPTHHGTGDVALMKTIPEMIIYNPSDSKSAQMSAKLSYRSKLPSYIRLDKGAYPSIYDSQDKFALGMKVIKPLSKINIFSTGYMTHQALKVYKKLLSNNVRVGIIDIFRLKPIDDKLLFKLATNSQKIVVLEENSKIGGLGSTITQLIANTRIAITNLAVKDQQFLNYGSREFLLKKNNLDVETITSLILQKN